MRKDKTLYIRLTLSQQQVDTLKKIARQTKLSVSDVVGFCMENEIENFNARLDAVKEMKG